MTFKQMVPVFLVFVLFISIMAGGVFFIAKEFGKAKPHIDSWAKEMVESGRI